MIQVETRFGAFRIEDGAYAINDTGDGAVIRMVFLPGPGVDATCFGVVQMANTVIHGRAEALGDDPIIRRHSIPAGEPGAGAHIDQDPSNLNPLYAVVAQPAGDTNLADGKAHPYFGTLGFRYQGGDGGLHVQGAAFHDAARLLDVDTDCSQQFETTCLAVAGAQAGVYYGSVSWGWEKDGAGKLTLLPLSLVREADVTDIFCRAVEMWNRSTSAAGLPLLPLPLPPGGRR